MSDEYKKVIRDPVYGYIGLTEKQCATPKKDWARLYIDDLVKK